MLSQGLHELRATHVVEGLLDVDGEHDDGLPVLPCFLQEQPKRLDDLRALVPFAEADTARVKAR
eukprot:19685-Lingulodinium_polyedra.AAC.1